MTAYTGPAELCWYANAHFRPGVPVDLRVTETPEGWDAVLRRRGDGEEFEFLLFLGAPHQLVFPDGSEFHVVVDSDECREVPDTRPAPARSRWLSVEAWVGD
ncbi:hypothetical protein AB0I28_38285 [Phytomonospora sp. NPDC050363]|uniref:hypothetical protein n=1 Tax=Phytomonospora sp. NPDC050363 TaxID=3155642 RepID=UPI003408FB0C